MWLDWSQRSREDDSLDCCWVISFWPQARQGIQGSNQLTIISSLSVAGTQEYSGGGFEGQRLLTFFKLFIQIVCLIRNWWLAATDKQKNQLASKLAAVDKNVSSLLFWNWLDVLRFCSWTNQPAMRAPPLVSISGEIPISSGSREWPSVIPLSIEDVEHTADRILVLHKGEERLIRDMLIPCAVKSRKNTYLPRLIDLNMRNWIIYCCVLCLDLSQSKKAFIFCY